MYYIDSINGKKSVESSAFIHLNYIYIWVSLKWYLCVSVNMYYQ